MNRLEIQDRPKFKKRVSNNVPSKFPRASGDRVSKPKFNKGKTTNSPNEKQTYGMCGKEHLLIALRRRIITLVRARVVTR